MKGRAITAAVFALVALGIYIGVVEANRPATPAVAATPTVLAKASKDCAQNGKLADDDKTLILDMKGDKFGSGDLAADEVMCFLTVLDVPTYIRAEMAETRALDGRQSRSWAGFEASWSYHPDNGLDIIIRQVST